MRDIYRSAGERIGQLRSSKDFTRAELAEMIGISVKFLYEIEAGKKGFSADVLYRLAWALGAGCDYILMGKEILVLDDGIRI